MVPIDGMDFPVIVSGPDIHRVVAHIQQAETHNERRGNLKPGHDLKIGRKRLEDIFFQTYVRNDELALFPRFKSLPVDGFQVTVSKELDVAVVGVRFALELTIIPSILKVDPELLGVIGRSRCLFFKSLKTGVAIL